MTKNEYNRRWYEAHREYRREYVRRWRKAHPERVREHNRRGQKTHPDHERNRKYYRTPRGRAIILATTANRKAKRLGIRGTFTGDQFLRLCAKYESRCVCCGKNKPLGPDHVKPFCKGGSNFIRNIQPACWPCNKRKRDKVIDFRKRAAA